jgi:hypothetical protein
VDTFVDLKFADGEYRFALPLLQIQEVQTKCGAGIGEIYARVLQGRMANDPTVAHPAYAAFHVVDLLETIRQGLIGGGQCIVDGEEQTVGPLRANQLIERYIGAPNKALLMPLKDLWDMTAAILFATIEGYAPAQEAAGGDKKKADPPTAEQDGSTTPVP